MCVRARRTSGTRRVEGSACSSRSIAPTRCNGLALVRPRRRASPTRSARAARVDADEQLAQEIERDGIDAFLERWLAQPLFATLPRERSGIEERRKANTVDWLTLSAARCSGRARSRRTGTDCAELAMPVLLIAGELDTKYVDIAGSGWRRRSPNAHVEVVAGAGPRVSPRATRRRRSPACLLAPVGVTASSSRSASTRRTASTPSTGTIGSNVTSPASIDARREPTRVGQLGQRGGERDAGCDPDRRLHHRETIAGTPAASATCERGAHAAERLLLQHDHVGGVERAQPARVVERADALVGRDRHVDPPPHPREIVERRDRLLDVLQVVRARGAPIMCTAVSTSHAPLASTRSASRGPTASRTAATSPTLAGVPHLDLDRREPRGASSTSKQPSTSAFTGTASRRAGGKPSRAASSAARGSTRRDPTDSPRAASTRPIRRALESVTTRSPMREPVLGQDRHSPTLTRTATTTSSRDVATSAATSDGGSVAVPHDAGPA